MNNQQKIRKIVLIAILSALIVVLAFIPIRIGPIEMTLTIIPIAVGAIVGGPVVGLALGGVFGMVSFLQCLGYSPFGTTLFGINPFLTFLLCVPTRILAGFLPALLYKLISKNPKLKIFGEALACLLVPLLNTIFFMSVLVLGFYQSEYIQGFVNYLNAPNPFVFVVLFVGLQGLIELLTGAIVSFPIARSLNVVFDRSDNKEPAK